MGQEKPNNRATWHSIPYIYKKKKLYFLKSHDGKMMVIMQYYKRDSSCALVSFFTL